MAVNYGTGTATQFTDATQRQVLELGKKIHYYNPSVTPILTVGGRASTRVSPVPIYEWMEDEYMLKKSISIVFGSGTLGNSATSGVNNASCVVFLNRQAQMEMFEVGGVYNASVSGGNVGLASMVAYMCIAVGKNVDHASATDKCVQFVGFDTISGASYTYDQTGAGTEILTGTSGTLTLDFAGIAQTGSLSGVFGHAATQTNLTNNDVFTVSSLGGHAEGAGVGKESRKRVRRLKNCTQIFREPYTITGTAQASKHYGGAELSRLQARKLAKIKGDVEWALLTNGDISLDATAENPQRTFAGFGVGKAAGAVQSFDGFDNTDMQIDYSSGDLDAFDSILEKIFHDMVSGTMKKTVFASNKWMKKLVSMARGDSSTALNAEMGSSETAGLRVTKYYGPVGECEFIPHPYLNGSLENYAIAIDFGNFEWRPLNGRDMKLRPDIVQDGSDGRTDEWLMEAGPEIRNEQTHAIMKLTA